MKGGRKGHLTVTTRRPSLKRPAVLRLSGGRKKGPSALTKFGRRKFVKKLSRPLKHALLGIVRAGATKAEADTKYAMGPGAY